MESEASPAGMVVVENEQQFWDGLQQIASAHCDSEDLIDNALRAYLSLTTSYKEQYLSTDYDVSRCSFELLSSNLFAAHEDYVRRQIIYSLLQEDDLDTLHLISSFLLFDGRRHEVTFHQMNDEGAFPRLLELIQIQRRKDEDNGAGLGRLLMDLLYEMSRIQRVKIEDLVLVDDEFVKCLFEMVEEISYDANDPYHYPVIRVLLVLNEQFMISTHDPVEESAQANHLTNRVIKILSMHGNAYKVFGENIILLINREGETSLQLLTLKLLYLIFTTPSTYEYFYTNDLRVLVDILIRNLLDLPEDAVALRHTYLRVLYPLLAHTQLKYPPHYKRDELKKVLRILVRGEFSAGHSEYEMICHFDDADETTKRLVARCAAVDWLRDVEPEVIIEEPLKEDATCLESDIDTAPANLEDTEPLSLSRTMSSSLTLTDSPIAPSPTAADESTEMSKSTHLQVLGMHLDVAAESSLSVREVAAQHERPGVMTPSRHDDTNNHLSDEFRGGPTRTVTGKLKVKPEPPKARRWRGRRIVEDEERPEKTSEAVANASLIPQGSSADRRNSAGASRAQPLPAHFRRSVSNPPPAVPPPRRSSHSVPTPHLPRPDSTSPAASPTSPHKLSQKPEPPRARRWGRGKHSQAGSTDSKLSESHGQNSIDENGDTSVGANCSAVGAENTSANVSATEP